jgi:mRNA interferase RelE/StbE
LVWTIEFRPNAVSDLRRLDLPVQRRIRRFLRERVIACGNPRQLGKPLHGNKGDLWSYRVGDYRIICTIEDSRLVVVVVALGHRGQIYR